MKRFLNFLGIFFLLLFILYLAIVFLLPVFLNSKTASEYIVDKIEANTNSTIVYEGFNLKISPFLKFIIKADNIDVYRNNEKTFNLRGLKGEFRPISLKSDKLYVEEIYLQKSDIFKSNSKKEIDINPIGLFNKLPEISVKKILIECGGHKKLSTKININNLDFIGKKQKNLSFDMKITSLHMTHPITISKENKIVLTSKALEVDDLKVYFGPYELFIDGTLISDVGNDFFVRGKKLPAGDIERTFIMINRYIKNKKHFLENFRDFKGDGYINLHIVNGSVLGSILIKNLSAYAKPIPVLMSFKKANFIFDDKDVYMQTRGKLGNEDVDWDFYLTGMMTDNLVISGTVRSIVSDAFAKTYIEGLSIKNTLDLSVDYLVKNGIVDVIYTAKLPINSDLTYFDARLGKSEFNREFSATTEKSGDKISLVNYVYSLNFPSSREKLIFGNGEFERINGKYRLTKLFAQTMDNAPVSLLGFLDDRLDGGYFNGNLEYDFKNNKIIGGITLEDTQFRQYKIDNAAVFAEENILTVLSKGVLKNEPFEAELILKNKFNKKNFDIIKLDLYLKKYVFIPRKRLKPKKTLGEHTKEIENSIQNIKKYPTVNADKITVRVGTFQKDKIIIENIILNASVKNNVLKYNIPDVFFAKGKISSYGVVNPDKKMFDMNFVAENVDSNTVGYQIFNLKDHLTGLASGKIHVKGDGKIRLIKGEGEFRIRQGELLKLARLSKNPDKLDFSKIIKIKPKVHLNPKSNITCNFKINNSDINDVNLYMQNDAISLYANGNYNIANQYTDLTLWGLYDDDVAKRAKIHHIPLNFISKFIFKPVKFSDNDKTVFKKVPSIYAREKDTKNFMLKLKGNINSPKLLESEFYRGKLN